MIDDEKVIQLINEAEWLLEGLPKSFWRLIKLSPLEIWQGLEDAEFEYVWVVAVFGNRCVFYDELNNGFVIGRYDDHRELSESSLGGSAYQLHSLIENLINSRFVVT